MRIWARAATALGLLVAVLPVTGAAGASPTLSVGPTTGLVDGTLVSVSVGNPLPDTSVSVRQCFGTDSTDQCWTYATGPQTAGGAPVTIRASRTQFFGPPLGPLVDCAVVTCFLHIEASRAFQAPYLVRDVALSFAAGAPTWRQPIAIASPASGLVDRSVVTLAGLGFSPGAELRVRECWVPFTYPWLERCQGNTVVTADAGGMMQAAVTVRRRFAATATSPAVTCGDSGTPCFLVIQRTDALGERAIVMLSFDVGFAPPTLLPLAVTVPEDVGVALVPVRIAAEPDRLVSTSALSWRTLPWTAGVDDFTAVAERTLVVSPYLPVVYLPVRIVDDTRVERDEIVFTHVTGAVNATVGGYRGVGVVVVTDND